MLAPLILAVRMIYTFVSFNSKYKYKNTEMSYERDSCLFFWVSILTETISVVLGSHSF